MFGSAAGGMTNLGFAKSGEATFQEVSVSVPPGVPTGITYTRASSVGYLYINGVLFVSFADTKDYTTSQAYLGNPETPGLELQSDIYAFSVWQTSAITAAEAFRLWKYGGNAAGAGLTPTLDLDFTKRIPGVIVNRATGAVLTFSGDAYWVNPERYAAAQGPLASVTGGTLDISAYLSGNVLVTIGANVSTVTFPSAAVYAGRHLQLQMSNGGTFTVAGWPASVKLSGGAFSLTAVLGKRDTLTFYCDGTNFWEVARAQNT
jgi:hypothetical protein